MNSIDPVVKKETKFIALVVLILSALMQSVFLIIGMWDLPVLLGNLLGGLVGVLNFFFMGLGLSSALKKETADAKQTAKFSQTMRNLMIVVTIVIAVFAPFFNLASTAIAIFFPTVGVFVRAYVMKKKEANSK